MTQELDITVVHDTLAAAWGRDALVLEAPAGRLFFQFGGEVATAHMIDARLAVAQCYAEVPAGLFPGAAGHAELCALANELNIAVARDLGRAVAFHVIEHRLHLCDLRVVDDVARLAELCTAQAGDVAAVLAALAAPAAPDRPAPDTDAPPQWCGYA